MKSKEIKETSTGPKELPENLAITFVGRKPIGIYIWGVLRTLCRIRDGEYTSTYPVSLAFAPRNAYVAEKVAQAVTTVMKNVTYKAGPAVTVPKKDNPGETITLDTIQLSIGK